MMNLIYVLLLTFSSMVFSQEPKVEIGAHAFTTDNKHLLAVTFENKEGWHTYWKNPGDAGMPPEFEFSLAGEEIELKELEWPAPKRFNEPGGLTVYGYDGVYSIFFELNQDQIEKNALEPLSIKVKWLVCENICLPEEADLSLLIKSNANGGIAGKTGALPADLGQIKSSLSLLPTLKSESEELQVFIASSSKKNELQLQYILKNADAKTLKEDSNLLTPFNSPLLSFKDERLYFDREGGSIYGVMDVEWDGEFHDPPVPLPLDGIFPSPVKIDFLFNTKDAKAMVIQKDFKSFSTAGQKSFQNYLGNLEPIKADASTDNLNSTPSTQSFGSLGYILLMAFLGGLILNFMPCVLPVVSLKLFGLIKQSGATNQEILKSNLLYTGGIIATFWALAVAVLILKASGEEVGWGFQLQSPFFVLIVSAVIFVMALNMFGLFEFGTPAGKLAGSVQFKKGPLKDFSSGILATILSTPCSAPLLGTALTFAFTTSNFNIFLILTFTGIGLASPFIVTAFFPRLISFLPKPGLWMDHLKKFLGLALLFTFAWLYSVLSAQIDYTSLGIQINLIFIMTFFAFFLRRNITKNALANILAFSIPLALITATLTSENLNARSKHEAIVAQSGELNWQSWSEEKMKALKGEWVFMDFTADWCLTCKVNEKLVINTASFKDFIAEKEVKLLLADWTRRDQKITKFLKKNGLVGVPAYFIQSPSGELYNLGETISLHKIERIIKN